MDLVLNAQRGIVIPQASLAAASFTSIYQLIGSLFPSPNVMVIIVSTMDAAVQFSWDGLVAAFPVLAGSAIILDLKSDGIALSAECGAYAKTLGTPTQGSLYIGGFTV